jgi:outer membrane protein TolC
MRPSVALLAFMLFSLALGGCAPWATYMAPEQPDRPWTPATGPDGAIIAGERPPADQPRNTDYVLPSNRALESIPPPLPDLERRHVYSLPELIDIAETNNPLTRNAWLDARTAALAAGIVWSTLLPRVSAGIIDGYQTSHFEGSALGIPVTSDVTLKGRISALAIEWLLFDFGERAALLDAAKQGSAISNIAFTAAHQQVIYNVSLAFYAHAAARARLASAAKSLRDAQEVQAAAEGRFKREIGTVVEVAQTRQATAEARLARVQAQGAVQDTYLAVIAAIGISPLTKIVIADVSRRKLSAAMTAPIERIVSEALARRPDVLTGYAALQASLANLRAAQVTYLPKVFVTSIGTRATGNLNITAIPGVGGDMPIVNVPPNQVGISGTQTGATTLIGATVPLYDAGSRAALREQAEAKVEKAETTLTRLRNEAARQIVVAENALKTSIAAYSAATALAAAAQTTFNAALSAYRNGVGSISDVTTAERALLLAENAATDAYSNALSAAATLALATGLLGGPPR